MKKYDHKKIEPKWQKEWAQKKTYKTKETKGKKKVYVLDMFPYPSGEGLHVGHPKGYIATDIYSRFHRMHGKNVLHPMGWDAFGLPAENFAIKHKIHPRKAVEKNIKNFKSQLAHIGFDYDWSREINTTDPGYYKWTQWIFLQLYKKGLAYQSNEPINWCPSCQTGLANEDLDGTTCERCGSQVEKRAIPQWVLRITAYADRMLEDLDTLQWPEHIKEQQRNWIGRSEGAHINFDMVFDNRPDAQDGHLTVFTTRPDTLFGATYMVLAPEHEFVRLALTHSGLINNEKEVTTYIKATQSKTEIDRTSEGKEKTGVRLEGIWAINPATHEKIPVYIADYVLAGYGTGAIMAVPAHDERDWAFAKKYDLPIKQVVVPCSDDPQNPPRPEFEEIKRDTIVVHLRDKSTGKFALLQWHGTLEGIVTAIMGGIEDGQTPEQAALTEIREEAALEHVRIIKVSPWITAARYCASHKGENRCAHSWVALAEIDSLETQGNIAAHEQSKHTLTWVHESEVLDVITPAHQKFMWKILHTEQPLIEAGYLINSDTFTGMDSQLAKKKITEKVGGTLVSTYKLRDWVFSRQRYWGEPIPIIHCAQCGAVPVPEKDLPVKLPEVRNYAPTGTGESPLAAIAKWVNTTCPKCKGKAKRETNTMPQWAGSSWYYLRFMDPANKRALVDKKKEKRWAPVDVYVGGDHAVRHLIYARFWHKFLHDIKVVSTIEPFARLEFLGFILAEDGRKMSKRYGNIINPDTIVKLYGADSLRVYEMFMGPFTDTIAWNTDNMIGARRFIERVWRLQEKVQTKDIPQLNYALHSCVSKVSADIEGFKFNTAVSAMMILLNEAERKGIGRKQFEMFLCVLAPFAPHITEELWHELGNKTSIHVEKWPKANPKYLVQSEVTIVVQINSKNRAELRVATGTNQMELERMARSEIADRLSGKQIIRTVVVPNKLVNFVVKE